MKNCKNWIKGLALVAVFLCTSVVMTACSFGFGSKSQSYKITYYANDGTERYNTETCYDYQKDAFTIGVGISFDRSWYRFVEWNTAADGTGTTYKSYAEYQITSDLNLYAIWEDATRQITYHANNGTEEVATQTFDSNRYVSLNSKSTFDLDGYEIAKWNTAANNTGTGYYPGSSYNITENIDLYAVWQPKRYSISYNYYTDSGSYLSSVTAADNPYSYNIETPTFTLQAPSKDGYTFESWYSEQEFVHPVTEIAQGTTGNLNLYAKFTLTPYAVTYVLDGGTINGNKPSTYTMQTDNFTLPMPIKSGYCFGGWYSESNFVNQVIRINSGTTGDMTLYAKWYTPTEVYNFDNGTITGITDLGKTLKIFDIPNQVNGVIVTAIGESAFKENNAITAIAIPASVTSIGADAFSGWKNLENVYITDLSAWCKMDFVDRDANPLYHNYYNGFHATCGLYIENELVKNLVIPNGVTNICKYAFCGCDLTSVTIPDCVTSIGVGAFDWIKNVYITDLSAWCKIDFGDEYANPVSANGGNLYLNNELVTDLIIPDGTTSIGKYAFCCNNFKSVTIPASVNSIGMGAFGGKYTSNIQAVYITDLSAWCKIDFGNSSANPLFINAALYLNDELVTDLIIPDDVTSIGKYVFSGCGGLTNVTISNHVTSIGDYAFYGFGLTTITIPDSITSIGNYAFAGSKLTNVIINACSIGSYAFNNCENLTSVTLGKWVTSIGDSAFWGCVCVNEVYISDLSAWCKIDFKNSSANPLNNGATLFYNYGLITDLVIPDGITAIKNYAFYGCNSITSVSFPDSVTSIGESAFKNICGLTDVFLGNGITSLGYNVFGDCKKFHVADLGAWCTIDFSYDYYYTDGYKCSNPVCNGASLYVNGVALYMNGELVKSDIVIPNGVTHIGSYAFYDCDNLTSITIPVSVTSIGQNAFYDCENLGKVYITNLVAWCQIDFAVVRSNPLVGYSYTFVDSNGFGAEWKSGAALYLNDELVTNLVIPDGVTAIKNYAFNGCNSITSVVIPASVSNIGDSVFSGCNHLVEVYNLSNLTITAGSTDHGYVGCYAKVIHTSSSESSYLVTANNGVIYYVNENDYIAVTYVGSATEIILDDKTTAINQYAFEGCSNLTGITISDSVTSIGKYAFYNCSGLTSIAIGNSVTNIGEYAFYNCSGLTSIAISNSVTNIGEYAFYNCSGLTSVTIGDSVTGIGSSAFRNCSSLTSVIIGSSVTSIGEYAFYNCSSLRSITIPDSVIRISNHAFFGCSSLRSVIFENTNNWRVSDLTYGGSSSISVTDATKNATHLTSYNYYWRRQ